jgi:hypothetical protein
MVDVVLTASQAIGVPRIALLMVSEKAMQVWKIEKQFVPSTMQTGIIGLP